MKKLILLAAMFAAPATAQPPKPPAPFPGSQGSKAHVYQQQMAEYRARLAAYNAPPPSGTLTAVPPNAPPLGTVMVVERDVPSVSRLDLKPPTAPELAALLGKLEAETNAAIVTLAEQIEGLAGDKNSFADFDKTVESAKKVNDLLMTRCEAIMTASKGLTAALGKLKKALTAAPKVYASLAADRRDKAGAAVFENEKQAWTDQADFADAARVLCEKRFAQLFSAPTSGKGAFDAEVEDSMQAIRRQRDVHVGWKEVLDAFPSTASGEKVDAALARLNTYAEDLDAYGGRMRALTDAMKSKAEELPASPKK